MLAALFSPDFFSEVQSVGEHDYSQRKICEPEAVHRLILLSQENTGREKKDTQKEPRPDLLINSKPNADYAQFFKSVGKTLEAFLIFHPPRLANRTGGVQ